MISKTRDFTEDTPSTMAGPYERAFRESVEHPEEFWGEAAKDIKWYRDYDGVLDYSSPPFYRWFTGGELNTCYNALDYHVESGRAGQVAIVYDSPVTDTVAKYTYTELRDQVATFAGALKDAGVVKGDRVLIGKYSGTEVKIEGDDYVILREDDVLATLAKK